MRNISKVFIKSVVIIYIIGGIFTPDIWCMPAKWHEVGPGGGGAVRDFAFDPHDSNRVYLTSDMVGVFASDDRTSEAHIGGIPANPVISSSFNTLTISLGKMYFNIARR